MRPVGSAPAGSARRRRLPPVMAAPSADLSAPFWVLEIEARMPGSAAVPEARGVGAAPAGARARRVASRENVTTIRVADTGYRTRPTDPQGVVPYPPLLRQAFAVDRLMGLSPFDAEAASSWGRAVLLNPDRRWDALAQAYSVEGRRARVLTGQRAWDAATGLWVDPPYAALREAFAGLCEPWVLTGDALEVPLRDVGYWLERPLLGTFAGTGGYEGTAEMAGQPKPLALGGTDAAPIRHVTPVLVDPVRQIYAVGGRVVRLYEGGDPTNIPAGGDVPDLYAGDWPLGTYRTDAARGYVQLHRAPAFALTADVVGGGEATAAGMARAIVARLGLPAPLLDAASLTGLAAAWPQPCGWWWGEQVQASTAIKAVLASVAARLVTTRGGLLRAAPLRALPPGTRPAASYGPAQIIDLVPVPLSDPLMPAPLGWQVGWGRYHTVQTSNLDGSLDDAAKALLAQAWRIEAASNTAVSALSRRPSRPGMVESAHLTAAGAQILAGNLRDLWCVPGGRPAYRVTLPAELAWQHEIGAPLAVRFPIGGFEAGRLVQVVGESSLAGGDTGTLTILT